MTDSFQYKILTPAIGVEIENLNLASLTNYDHLQQPLMDLLLQHHVIFLRSQNISPVQMKNFASIFGDLHIHPLYPSLDETPEIIVLDTDDQNPPDNDNWHTDVTFIKTPPLGAVLSAQQIPPTGGDTLWASCIAAYESLSKPMQMFLDGLTATHDIVKSFPKERYGNTEEKLDKWQESIKKHQPVTHPVVRTHPVSGRKGLFVYPLHKLWQEELSSVLIRVLTLS